MILYAYTPDGGLDIIKSIEFGLLFIITVFIFEKIVECIIYLRDMHAVWIDEHE